MGFPTWTLIGMGVTFVGALLLVILSYLAQSPGTAARVGLGNAHLDRRLKTFTGLALALMLLSLGFFLAGVPLDPALTAAPDPAPTVSAASAAIPTSGTPATLAAGTPTAAEADSTTPQLENTTPVTSTLAETSSSGAFDGPPPDDEAEDPANVENQLPDDEPATPAATGTTTPVTFTPTSTPTASPTATPTATTTPTPIVGETAVLDLAGGVVWMYRSPGGQTMVILQDEEVVVLQPRSANRAGVIWREITTGNGTTGWVEEQFLNLNEEAQ